MCGDTGSLGIYWDEDDDAHWVACTCQPLAKRYKLPPEMLEWTWDTFPGAPKAREFAEETYWKIDSERPKGTAPKWLIITGPVGSGKTGLAVCLYKDFMDEDPSTVFFRTSELLDIEKRSFSDDGDHVSILERIGRTCHTLILDDVGSERGTEWEITAIRNLLTVRYERRLRTILTTNLSIEELGQCYGQRIADRLADVAVGLVLTGPSLRPRMKVYKA